MRILKEANVIKSEIAEYVNHVIDMLSEYDLNEDLMSMFTTHLAMASQRVLDQAELENLGDDLWQQVTSSSNYDDASKICAQIIELAPVEYPESETRFLMMHLCNLFQD